MKHCVKKMKIQTADLQKISDRGLVLTVFSTVKKLNNPIKKWVKGVK